MPERDVEEALRDALREESAQGTNVSATQVLDRIGSRRSHWSPLAAVATSIVLVVVVTVVLAVYLRLPSADIALGSPTPARPTGTETPMSTPSATSTQPAASGTPSATTTPGPSGTVAATDAAATGTPPPATDLSSWHGLVWQLPPQDAFIRAGNQYLQDVTALGAGFVAVGYDMGAGDGGGPSDGVIWTSPDGYAWQRLSLSADLVAGNSLNEVIKTPAGLIAYGTSSMLVSLDGRQWRGVDYNIGRVVRVKQTADGFLGRPAGAGDFDLRVSPDGLTWRRVQTVGLEAALLNAVTYNAFGYFAIGVDRDSHWRSWRSPDAVTWEPFELAPGIPASGIWSMAGSLFAGPQPCPIFQGGGCGAIFRQSELYRSDDGATWTRIELPDQAPYRFGDHTYWTGGWMVGVPNDFRFGEPLLLSSDGVTWQSVGNRRSGELDVPGATFPSFSHLVLGSHGVLIAGAAISDSGPTAVDPILWFGAVDDGTLPAQTFAPRP